MNERDPILGLLSRFHEEGVEYVLVGGQAVRLNGYVRATEDVDVLVKPGRDNGERIIRALDPSWFEPTSDGQPENIRVADDLLVDLHFSANGETYESLQPCMRDLEVEGTPIRVLDIDGLLRTKTDYREKDRVDRQVLLGIKEGLRR